MSDNQTDRSGSFYSFGETNLAAERLRVISGHGSFGEVIFEPSGQIAAGASVRGESDRCRVKYMPRTGITLISNLLRNNRNRPS